MATAVLAPAKAYSPPITQTAMISPVFWSWPATTPVILRIPMPIVPPLATATPKVTPRMRSNRFFGRDLLPIEVCSVGTGLLLSDLTPNGKRELRNSFQPSALNYQPSTSPILFVADLFHPVDRLTVELLRDGDMRHGRVCCRNVA